MNIVVLDIGGSSVKVWKSLSNEPDRIETGENFTPPDLVRETSRVLADLTPDRISLGYPGLVNFMQLLASVFRGRAGR